VSLAAKNANAAGKSMQFASWRRSAGVECGAVFPANFRPWLWADLRLGRDPGPLSPRRRMSGRWSLYVGYW